MTDIVALEGELMRMVETAADEAALEAVRVAALGKKGSISALLATLGRMSPEERKEKGPLINGLKERGHRGDRGAARSAQARRARSSGSPARPSTSPCRRSTIRPMWAASIRSAR